MYWCGDSSNPGMGTIFKGSSCPGVGTVLVLVWGQFLPWCGNSSYPGVGTVLNLLWGQFLSWCGDSSYPGVGTVLTLVWGQFLSGCGGSFDARAQSAGIVLILVRVLILLWGYCCPGAGTVVLTWATFLIQVRDTVLKS